jgi:protein-disulfide isomerase
MRKSRNSALCLEGALFEPLYSRFTFSVRRPLVIKPIRFAVALFATLMIPAMAVAEILSTEEALSERVIGDPDAPITIIEYASMTCPHCADFHSDTLPLLKEEWIETGKAKLVYRDFPLDKYAAAASQITRCAPKDKYFIFLNAFYSQQESWTKSQDPIRTLTQLAALGGLTQADVDACLANEELQDGILQMRLEGQMEFGINSTPTFVIDEKKVPNLPYDDFKEILEDAAK